MRDVDHGWDGMPLPGPLDQGERGPGHRCVGANDSRRRGTDKPWTGPTRFGEHGSPSDGEIEIKSMFGR